MDTDRQTEGRVKKIKKRKKERKEGEEEDRERGVVKRGAKRRRR